MQRLLSRAGRLAEAAQRRRLEEIAGVMRARGVLAELSGNKVISRGKALADKWLADPLLRFAGRSR